MVFDNFSCFFFINFSLINFTLVHSSFMNMDKIMLYISISNLINSAWISNNIVCTASDVNNLVMVSVLFRHGDRAPIKSYPNDPYKNFEWPGGFESLSQVGSLQGFNLGEKLRKNYESLLPESGMYTKYNMYVMSSHYERCLMTAGSLLAGFFPPNQKLNHLPISWQPIPIHSFEENNDSILAQDKPCAKYEKMFDDIFKHDFKKINKENEALYRYITKHSGKNITNIGDISDIFGVLYIEQNAGLKLPNWTNNVFPDKMLPLVHKYFQMFTKNNYMKKIRGGPFITEIVKNMHAKQKNNLNPDRKIFLYSAHDLTIVGVCDSLKILNQTSSKPDYTAALSFELYKLKSSQNHELKIYYYRNSEDEYPIDIEIPNCGRPCLLNDFGKIVKPLILVNYDQACRNK